MKLLLAPVLVTATKPLTPTHIKGLVWLDLFYKWTSYVHDVVYLSNRLSDDTTSQTLAFWQFLDERGLPGSGDYSDKDDLWIAEQYLRFHGARFAASPEAIHAQRARAEGERYMHGISRRLVEIWQAQYRQLGVRDPGLLQWQPFGIDEPAVLDAVARLGCSLDVRSLHGGVYLDFTDAGVPLRQIVDERGMSNYLVQTLRELLPLATRFDRIVLAFDGNARHDFHLVERVLALAGGNVSAVSMSRVPLDGIVGSSRLGGWAECTCTKILERYRTSHEIGAVRLGLRLYFVLRLGQEGRESFSYEHLTREIDRAEGLLGKLRAFGAEDDVSHEDMRAFLAPLARRDEPGVSPNRLLRTVVEQAARSLPARTVLRRIAEP